jgi:hypothetical protein
MFVEEKTQRIGRLAAEIARLQAELLAEVVEVDRVEGWRADGAANVESWLVAMLGVSHHTARGWAEVAGRLDELPEIAAGLATGRLSFDQVRTLCRFATPEEDAELAGSAESESVTRLQREARRRQRVAEREVRDAREARSLHWWRDRQARVVRFQGALADQDWTVVQTALDRIADQAPPDPDGGLRLPTERRHADALLQMASQALGADTDADRATVVIHMDAAGVRNAEFENGLATADSVLHRLACDARIETVLEDSRGVAVGVGRATRRIPAWLARQLRYRDQGCRFPGCERRHWVHAHHLVHWIDGGPTDLENLITLCGYHHRLVHEHRWRIVGDPNHDVAWIRPDGSTYDPRRTRLLQHALDATGMRARFADSIYQRTTVAAQV